jgi:DNA transposition AAA+ family ATPase
MHDAAAASSALKVVEGGSPNEPPSQTREMTQARMESAIRQLNAYKNNAVSKKTDDDLARELGGRWKPGTIQLFRNGHMQLENARLIVEAAELLLAQIDERAGLITKSAFVNTSISKRLLSLIKRAIVFNRMAVGAVEPGLGKTRTLEEFARVSPLSVLIRANRTFWPSSSVGRSMSSPWPLFTRLAQEFHVDHRTRYPSIAYEEMVRKIKGTNRVILIDQAQYIPPEAFDLLTTLHEEAQTPIVLFGWTRLYEAGPREFEALTAYQSRTFRELFTRAQIKQADVLLIAEQFIGRALAESRKEKLLEQAKKDGGLRRLDVILQHAQTLPGAGETLLTSHIDEAIKYVDASNGGVA